MPGALRNILLNFSFSAEPPGFADQQGLKPFIQLFDTQRAIMRANQSGEAGMAGKLWARQIRRNKMIADAVSACDRADWQEALSACCRQMDIGVPMVLARHEQDWQNLSQTRFLPEHFLEQVRFDRLEVEYFDPDQKKKKPQNRYG